MLIVNLTVMPMQLFPRMWFRTAVASAVIFLAPGPGLADVDITLTYDISEISIRATGPGGTGPFAWEFPVRSVPPFTLQAGVEETISVNIVFLGGTIVSTDENGGISSPTSYFGRFVSSAGQAQFGGTSRRQLTLPEVPYNFTAFGQEGPSRLVVGSQVENGIDFYSISIGRITYINRTTLDQTTTFDSFELNGSADFVETQGSPILPIDPVRAPAWLIPVPGGCVAGRCRYDPEVATGYAYSRSDPGAPNFEAVLIAEPLPNGDNTFEVSFGGQSHPLTAGDVFMFTDFVVGGVSTFSITGIDTAEMLDPDDPQAFVTDLSFVVEGAANPFDNPYARFELLMEPITTVVNGDPPTLDADGDGIEDAADNCPAVSNADQTDTDADGVGDACDTDDDNDNVPDETDNCPLVPNSDQADTDGDGFGNVCDGDQDGDGVENALDNCPFASNPDQTDTDGDGVGDECDSNDDNDVWDDSVDNCPSIFQLSQDDLDADGIGDACDADIDGDGVDNLIDNCPVDPNASQDDTDADGLGDACDSDSDGDGVDDEADNCPFVSNPDQADLDGNGVGDACDTDTDGDGVANGLDNCPSVANTGQTDVDGDGLGDACDDDIDGDGVINALDACEASPMGDVVAASGCTIVQSCPCDGPRDTIVPWRNRGKYVSCVSRVSADFVEWGLISEATKDGIVSEAARSSCGE